MPIRKRINEQRKKQKAKKFTFLIMYQIIVMMINKYKIISTKFEILSHLKN